MWASRRADGSAGNTEEVKGCLPSATWNVLAGRTVFLYGLHELRFLSCRLDFFSRPGRCSRTCRASLSIALHPYVPREGNLNAVHISACGNRIQTLPKFAIEFARSGLILRGAMAKSNKSNKLPPREGIVCPRCGSGWWRLDRNWNGSPRCRCVACRKAWMLERWKKPRGRRQTPPATLAIVHRMLAAGITETALLSCAANITRWNASNIRRNIRSEWQVDTANAGKKFLLTPLGTQGRGSLGDGGGAL